MARLAWQELYETALLELRSQELRPAIERAEAAIDQRLRELATTRERGTTAENESDEQHDIADALRSLRTLAKMECRPLSASPTDVPSNRGGGIMNRSSAWQTRNCRHWLTSSRVRRQMMAERLTEQWREIRLHATIESDAVKLTRLAAESEQHQRLEAKGRRDR